MSKTSKPHPAPVLPALRAPRLPFSHVRGSATVGLMGWLAPVPAAAAWGTGPALLAAGVAGGLVAAAGFALWYRRRERDPSVNAARFISWVRGSPDILLVVDEQERIVEASDQALRAYGYAMDELRQLTVKALGVGSAPVEPAEDRVVTLVHRRKDGTTFPVDLHLTRLSLPQGRRVLYICQDVTVQQERQQQLDRVNQLYSVLRQLNQAIIRAATREELEESVCNALVGPGRFQAAWIGWKEPGSATVRPSTCAGDLQESVDHLVVSMDEAPVGFGPTGTAIRENRTYVCEDFLTDPHTRPWRETAAEHGLRASITLPLRTAKGQVGALSVYARERSVFGREEVALLEQCVADICFALDRLDETASHHLVEERLVLLGSALEGAPIAIVISDRNDAIEWVNPAFVANSGYTSEEVAGRHSSQLRIEHQPNVTENELWRVISAGQPWHGELISRRKNGQPYVEDTSIVPVRDRHGTVCNFVSLRQDITARKGAEQRVREQAALLDQASEAIVVGDLNHRVMYWNRGAERLFGLTVAEALGRQLLDAFALETTIGSTNFQQAIATPRDWRGEIRTHDRKGNPLTIETSITPLLDDAGRLYGRLYVSANITTKKELEEQFLRVQRMENIGMLAAGVAHDLNNILAPMRMVGPLLRDRLSEPRDLKLLDTLETCAIRGAALVRQILGFAHGVAGEPRMVQVKHLLRDVIDVITATFPKSITLEEMVPTDLWPIMGNPTQIHQVLLNLCVNARDAMPNGGTLELRAMNRNLDAAAVQGIEGAHPGPWLVIEVEDSGTGIPPEVLEHMWEPLYTTKAEGKGTGLGLSTVRSIVAAHHGFLTVTTAMGYGSTFRVHFPAESSGGAEEGPETPCTRTQAKGELILFVDDEASVRDVASTALTRQGYRVMTAGDGAEAIAQFAPHAAEIALVITDLDMPNFDGAALCRVINTLSPKTKLLAISGFASAAPSEPAGIAFLPKPFGLDGLLQKTDGVLHGTGGEPVAP